MGQSIVHAMQTDCVGADPDDPHAGLSEDEYQELMASLEDALLRMVQEEEQAAKQAGKIALREKLRVALWRPADESAMHIWAG